MAYGRLENHRKPDCICRNFNLKPFSDGTNQYIRGKEEAPAEDLLARSGLGVVTILIGIFSRSTGEVKGGVVNQPFVSLKVRMLFLRGKILVNKNKNM